MFFSSDILPGSMNTRFFQAELLRGGGENAKATVLVLLLCLRLHGYWEAQTDSSQNASDCHWHFSLNCVK